MIAEILLRREAVILRPQEPFTFASGIKSPIYCDNRVLLSYPEDRKKIVQALGKLAKSFKPAQIAGVATAGIAWGAWLAEELDLPYAYVRAAAKEHGRKNRIEGRLDSSKPTLVVEDLVSTAGSVISALEALNEENIKIAGAVSIFSYGFPEAVESFRSKNCDFKPVVTLEEMLEAAQKLKKIKPDEVALVKKWKSNPKNWG